MIDDDLHGFACKHSDDYDDLHGFACKHSDDYDEL